MQHAITLTNEAQLIRCRLAVVGSDTSEVGGALARGECQWGGGVVHQWEGLILVLAKSMSTQSLVGSETAPSASQ